MMSDFNVGSPILLGESQPRKIYALVENVR